MRKDQLLEHLLEHGRNTRSLKISLHLGGTQDKISPGEANNDEETVQNYNRQ